MVDEYENLSGLVDKVVEEAIYAQLKGEEWYPDGSGNLVYRPGTVYERTRPGPGRGYPDDAADVAVAPGDTYAGVVPTLGEIYRKWEAAIPLLFEPFKGLPDPTEFQTLADHGRNALALLSVQGSKNKGVVPSGGSAAVDYPGNTTLALADQVAQVLNTWQGAAAGSFAAYLNRFETVAANQAVASDVLRLTLLMEKELWKRLRADVVTFAHDSARAFRHADALGAAGVKSALTVAKTVNTIIGYYPPAKTVSEGVDKVLTVGTFIFDSLRGTEPATNLLDGKSPDEVLANMRSHVKKLTWTAWRVETDIETSLDNLNRLIQAPAAVRPDGSSDDPTFTLQRPNGFFSADDADDLVYPDTVVNPANIKTAARMLEDDLAPELASAAKSLAAADESRPWWRDDASIGCGGNFGCSGSYTSVSTTLEQEIRETSKELEWAAEMLRAVAADLTGTDDDVSGAFAGVRNKINAYDTGSPAAAAPSATPLRKPPPA